MTLSQWGKFFNLRIMLKKFIPIHDLCNMLAQGFKSFALSASDNKVQAERWQNVTHYRYHPLRKAG